MVNQSGAAAFGGACPDLVGEAPRFDLSPVEANLHGKLDRSMTLYSYPITVEREGKRYYAYSEDFPGVYGLGKSIEQAKKSILEAMRLYIQHCRKKGKAVPVTRTVYAETVTLAMD